MNVKRLVALPLLLLIFGMLYFWFAPARSVQAAATNQSQPAAPRSRQLTVVLTPTQDVSIDSLNPTVNFEGSPELLVASLTPTALAVQNSLLRFDLQAIIPAGSLINKAQ